MEVKPLIMPSSALSVNGIPIYVCNYLPKTKKEQFRFPRSKKKRIRKKWRKNPENYHDRDCTKDIWILDGLYLISDEGMKALRDSFDSDYSKVRKFLNETKI